MTSPVETPADLAGGVYEATVRQKAAELKQELIKQTLNDFESWRKALDLEWQRAHPDQVNVSPIPPEEARGYVNTIRNEYYEWVEPAFERYLDPDPDATNPMIAALRTVESSFGGSQDNAAGFTSASAGLARINDVRSEMNHWQGDLKDNFIDNFVTPLETASVNQAAVAKVTREYLECNKAFYIECRKSIIDLLGMSIEAVRTLANGKDPKRFTWVTLAMIAVGTGLTLGTGGLAVAGTILVIGGTLAQGNPPDDPVESELSAPTAQEVAVKIVEAMTKMDARLDREETKVKRAFEALLDAVAGARSVAGKNGSAGPLAVPAPALSSAPPREITDGSLRPHD